jgi:hypothetical protein
VLLQCFFAGSDSFSYGMDNCYQTRYVISSFGYPICLTLTGTVLSLYTKSNSKNGKHSWVSDSSNICLVSYLAVQVFKHMHGQQFHAILQDLTPLQAKRFVLVNAHAFLCMLDYEPWFLMEKTNLMVSANNIQCYYMFKKEAHKINTVIESLMKQKRAGKDCKDVDSD